VSCSAVIANAGPDGASSNPPREPTANSCRQHDESEAAGVGKVFYERKIGQLGEAGYGSRGRGRWAGGPERRSVTSEPATQNLR
jgi:hypothetical protein